ncbi:Leucoanthocyanidin reductase [Perkinsus chesapeaki]|uniref:Leucoanthocyanidin reductase n=1 Tax=Perkinsus chesapeaki TaxID=330153 RepID=A0A7J6M238_PERCH|nr:Leucoanthocyanidin reductase [Perkinsus chesapeaki]
MPTHTVAVIGATGMFGKEISLSLLKLGNAVIAFTRSITDKKSVIQQLECAGAKVVEVPDLTDEASVATAFRDNKVDTVICAMHGTAPVIENVEGHIINAAVKSGTVQRFCPDEFGVHTGAIPWGMCKLFDVKKGMQERVRKSGMKWTCIFMGGLFPYFLPSLKYGRGVIESYGNMDAVFYNNYVGDAGLMIAKAATDDRTVNKYVQFQVNPSTQAKNLARVRKLYPDHEFPEKHFDEAELIRLMRDDGDNEKWAVQYAIFCMGRMNCVDFPNTMLGNTIMPSDYKYTTIEECLSDPSFVFPDNQ